MSKPSFSRRNVIRGGVAIGAIGAVGGWQLWRAVDADAAVPNPGIASCSTWGARAASGLSEVATDANKIVIHHTATPNQSNVTKEAAYALARSIQAFHMDDQGWADTGQHFTVSRGGFLMEGRHKSLSHLTSGNGMVVGAHCPGQNSQGIGIENEGTYTSATPPTALWNGLVKLCAYICQQYNIAPTKIYGHRDYIATQCPGDKLYAMLPSLRTAVRDTLDGGGSTDPGGWTTTVDNGSSGFEASGNWGVSTYSTQKYSANYRYANPAEISDGAYFSATLPSAGNYKVETWYPADAGYNASTPFVVFASGGSKTVVVNQQTNGGKWVSLGTFSFAAGAQQIAAVSRWSGSTAGYVIADAIRVTQA